MSNSKIRSTTLVLILLNIAAWTGLDARPPNLDLYKLYTKVRIGERMIIKDLTLLDKYVNESFPEAFRTDINPEEYFRVKSNHTSFEKKLFQLMTGSLSSSSSSSVQGRVKRGTDSSSCPVNWAVEYESTRKPSGIWKAICNGQGTTCLSPGSNRPSCEHFSVALPVMRFLGINPTGQQFWKWEKETVPVGCRCSGL